MTTTDMRARAIAELAFAVETGGDVEQAVHAAFMADVEPYEIAELGGLPTRRVLEIPGRPRTDSTSRHEEAPDRRGSRAASETFVSETVSHHLGTAVAAVRRPGR